MSDPLEDAWYCFECNGLGGWEEDGEEVDWGPSEYRDCPCCYGAGKHHGDDPPECHPAALGPKEGA
jgi:DnaJ-class molecular chaperone